MNSSTNNSGNSSSNNFSSNSNSSSIEALIRDIQGYSGILKEELLN